MSGADSYTAAMKFGAQADAIRSTVASLDAMRSDAVTPAIESIQIVAQSLPPSTWTGAGGDAFRSLTDTTIADLTKGYSALVDVRTALFQYVSVLERAMATAAPHLRAIGLDDALAAAGGAIIPLTILVPDVQSHLAALDTIVADVSSRAQIIAREIRAAASSAPQHAHWATAPISYDYLGQPTAATNPSGFIGYLPVIGTLFGEGGPTAADVAQGPLGDCYLLASAAAIAENTPWVIGNRIVDNGDGTYSVTLTGPNGKDVTTVVDAQVPFTQSSGFSDSTQLLPGPGSIPTIWPVLVEKAYAEVYGSNSYNNIAQGGWPDVALKALTGKNVVTTATSGTSDQPIASALATSFNEQDPTMAALAAKLNVVSGHAYYVTGYDAKTGLVQLGNPWGATAANTPLPMSVHDFRLLAYNLAVVH